MVKILTSVDHPHIKHLAKLRVNRDYRHEHHSVVIVGTKPSSEVAPFCQVKSVLVYDESFLPEKVHADYVYVVNQAIMKKASGMLAPEGILLEVAMPKPATLKGAKQILVLDGVNDPGNLGALLRTALALGWDGAFILENSCDPFNDKALKAARGATFRLPIKMGTWKELNELSVQEGWSPVVADLDGVPPEKISKKEKILLILGNEAHGASLEAKELGDKVTIPMPGPMESLNVSVAGGILLYLLKKGKNHD